MRWLSVLVLAGCAAVQPPGSSLVLGDAMDLTYVLDDGSEVRFIVAPAPVLGPAGTWMDGLFLRVESSADFWWHAEVPVTFWLDRCGLPIAFDIPDIGWMAMQEALYVGGVPPFLAALEPSLPVEGHQRREARGDALVFEAERTRLTLAGGDEVVATWDLLGQMTATWTYPAGGPPPSFRFDGGYDNATWRLSEASSAGTPLAPCPAFPAYAPPAWVDVGPDGPARDPPHEPSLGAVVEWVRADPTLAVLRQYEADFGATSVVGWRWDRGPIPDGPGAWTVSLASEGGEGFVQVACEPAPDPVLLLLCQDRLAGGGTVVLPVIDAVVDPAHWHAAYDTAIDVAPCTSYVDLMRDFGTINCYRGPGIGFRPAGGRWVEIVLVEH